MVVVAPTTHFRWPIAMPRVVVPGEIPDEKIMYPLEPTFKEYPQEKFELVPGSASGLHTEGSVVTVALNDGTSRAVPYDNALHCYQVVGKRRHALEGCLHSQQHL